MGYVVIPASPGGISLTLPHEGQGRGEQLEHEKKGEEEVWEPREKSEVCYTVPFRPFRRNITPINPVFDSFGWDRWNVSPEWLEWYSNPHLFWKNDSLTLSQEKW